MGEVKKCVERGRDNDTGGKTEAEGHREKTSAQKPVSHTGLKYPGNNSTGCDSVRQLSLRSFPFSFTVGKY